jgi:hypothetical protein
VPPLLTKLGRCAELAGAARLQGRGLREVAGHSAGRGVLRVDGHAVATITGELEAGSDGQAGTGREVAASARKPRPDTKPLVPVRPPAGPH